MFAHGGNGDDDYWDGGCGTVYVDCGPAPNTLYLDGGSVTTTPTKPTLLVDSGVTTWNFDHLKMIRGATVAFASYDMGTSLATVSINASSGDATSWLHLTTTTDRAAATKVILTGEPSGQFLYDSNYQATDGSVVVDGTGQQTYQSHWNRLYYMSAVEALQSYHVTVDSGSELVAPTRLVISSVTLSLSGELSGVSQMAVGHNGVFSFTSTATCNSSTTGEVELQTLDLDGRSDTGSSTATASLYLNSGTTLAVDDMTVAYATVYINGAAEIEADSLNITTNAYFSGKGRGYAANTGPGRAGQAETPGCTVTGSNNIVGSHGGAGGGTDAEGRCCYGSTFEPVTQGTGSGSVAGGAALKITAGDLTYEGTIDMDGNTGGHDQSGAAGGSAWVTTGTLSGSGGSIRAIGGNTGSRYGNAGGGGGRVALYCDSSTYTGTMHMMPTWELPNMYVHGGAGDDDYWDGGCGTVYINCSAVSNTLLLDGGGQSTTPYRPTVLADQTDPPTTNYTLDKVHIIRNAELSVTATCPALLSLAASDSSPRNAIAVRPSRPRPDDHHSRGVHRRDHRGPNRASLAARARTLLSRPACLALALSRMNPSFGRYVTVPANKIVNLAPSQVSGHSIAETPVTHIQFISATEKHRVTTETFVTGSAVIEGAHICVQSGGELALPENAHVCYVEVVNGGSVSGVAAWTSCDTGVNGGGYFDAYTPPPTK